MIFCFLSFGPRLHSVYGKRVLPGGWRGAYREHPKRFRTSAQPEPQHGENADVTRSLLNGCGSAEPAAADRDTGAPRQRVENVQSCRSHEQAVP